MENLMWIGTILVIIAFFYIAKFLRKADESIKNHEIQNNFNRSFIENEKNTRPELIDEVSSDSIKVSTRGFNFEFSKNIGFIETRLTYLEHIEIAKLKWKSNRKKFINRICISKSSRKRRKYMRVHFLMTFLISEEIERAHYEDDFWVLSKVWVDHNILNSHSESDVLELLSEELSDFTKENKYKYQRWLDDLETEKLILSEQEELFDNLYLKGGNFIENIPYKKNKGNKEDFLGDLYSQSYYRRQAIIKRTEPQDKKFRLIVQDRMNNIKGYYSLIWQLNYADLINNGISENTNELSFAEYIKSCYLAFFEKQKIELSKQNRIKRKLEEEQKKIRLEEELVEKERVKNIEEEKAKQTKIREKEEEEWRKEAEKEFEEDEKSRLIKEKAERKKEFIKKHKDNLNQKNI